MHQGMRPLLRSKSWVIACSIVETPSSRMNPFLLNKVIRNILFNVNLMKMITLNPGLECFGMRY